MYHHDICISIVNSQCALQKPEVRDKRDRVTQVKGVA